MIVQTLQEEVLVCKQVETSQLGMEQVASPSMAEPSQMRTSNVSALVNPIAVVYLWSQQLVVVY